MLTHAFIALISLAEPPPPVFAGRQDQLQVSAPRREDEIAIDGKLDEAAWAAAARLTEFSQYSPNDGRPAEQGTEVLVFYSPTAIYFGVRAQAAPGSVRASLAQRDYLDAEDTVTFLLSTFNDGRQAIALTVNPLGVQADGTLIEGLSTGDAGGGFSGLATGRETPNLAPDFVFQSKGRLTPAGYEIEVRVPFKSLRYQKADTQSWGLHVLRVSQSSGFEDSWAPARRSATSFLTQGGVIAGMRDLHPGLVLDLNPEVTGRLDGIRSGNDAWRYHGRRPEVGGNVRWGVTPNLSLTGTVNPDFSQVESDISQIQYDPRQALFFEEKRPFFLDGLEQFATPNRLVYTRRVVSPLAAVKLTGTLSGTSVGLLSAVDDENVSRTGSDHPVYNVLRVRRDLGQRSRLGLVYTDRIEGSDWNRVAAIDARIALGQTSNLDLQGSVSGDLVAGVKKTAPLWNATFNRNGKRLGTRLLLSGIDDDFRARAGFISRAGIVHALADQRVSFFGREGSFLEVLNSDLVLDGTWQYDAFFGAGGVQDRKLHFNNNATLRGGWKVGGSILVETFGYDPSLYTDYAIAGDRPGEILPFVGTPRIPNLDWVASFSTPQFKRFDAEVSAVWGRDENFSEWASGKIAYLTVDLNWRPTEQLRANLLYNLQQVNRRTDGSVVTRRHIPRLKIEYQATRAIFGRVVAEYVADYQDDLRDVTRTERPILIRNAAGGYDAALGKSANDLRIDALFAWQPTPGTVFFAGYGSSVSDADLFAFRGLRRTQDGFFVKFSYLFRL